MLGSAPLISKQINQSISGERSAQSSSRTVARERQHSAHGAVKAVLRRVLHLFIRVQALTGRVHPPEDRAKVSTPRSEQHVYTISTNQEGVK